MPRYSVSPGDHVEITLKGYVVYNAGGFLAITNSKKLLERFEKGDGATFDRDKGEFYFDIPEYMIASEPAKTHEYPEGTLARVSGVTKVAIQDVSRYTGGALVLEYRHTAGRAGRWGATNWFFASTEIPVYVDPEASIRIIWNPEED